MSSIDTALRGLPNIGESIECNALVQTSFWPYNATMKSTAASQPANAQTLYEVTAKDLPLACPLPTMSLWNSHPRVYLAIEPTGWAKCPYCGAEYTLKR
jgi:uncharacterized Zn-finger protein